jgi:Domain of unknown function (DUF4884)
MKIITFLFLIFLITGCYSGKPLTKQKADNNNTYTVQYLFDHDGCKVYRFKDEGHYVYFTSCKGETVSLQGDSVRIKSQNSRN